MVLCGGREGGYIRKKMKNHDDFASRFMLGWIICCYLWVVVGYFRGFRGGGSRFFFGGAADAVFVRTVNRN